MNKTIIRTAALELQGVNNHEVVKIAGVLRRVKNWLKGLVNSDFRDSVSKMRNSSESMKYNLDELGKHIDLLLSAIKDGEVDQFDSELVSVRTLASEIAKNTDELNEAAEEARVISEEEYVRRYTTEQYDDPEKRKNLIKQIKKQMPKGHDVEMGFYPDTPDLIAFKWFRDLKPEDITFGERVDSKGEERAKNSIVEIISRTTNINEEDAKAKLEAEWPSFVNKLKAAIVNGKLKSYTLPKPSKEMKGGRNAGEINMSVILPPLELLSGSGIIAQITAVLLDMSPAHIPIKKFVIGMLFFNRIVANGVPVKHKPKRKSDETVPADGYSSEDEDEDFAPADDGLVVTAEWVEKILTPLSPEKLAEVLKVGYEKAFGEKPDINTLGIGWAQCALENGNGSKIYNNNIGNVRAFKSWIMEHNYYKMTTQERNSSGKYDLKKGAKWRSYDSPEESAYYYWKIIGSDRHKAALPRFKSGDVEGAMQSLSESTYYTADPEHYSGAVANRFAYFIKNIAPKIYPQSSKVKKTNIDAKSEADKLYSQLDIAASDNYVTNFVKKAILKKELPTSNVKVDVIGSTVSGRVKFAKSMSNVLKEILDVDAKLIISNDQVQIDCVGSGTPFVLTKAIQELCDYAIEKKAKNIQCNSKFIQELTC